VCHPRTDDSSSAHRLHAGRHVTVSLWFLFVIKVCWVSGDYPRRHYWSYELKLFDWQSYMYIYIYGTCIPIYIYIYIGHIYICIHIYVYIIYIYYIYIYIYMSKPIYICVYIYIYQCMPSAHKCWVMRTSPSYRSPCNGFIVKLFSEVSFIVVVSLMDPRNVQENSEKLSSEISSSVIAYCTFGWPW